MVEYAGGKCVFLGTDEAQGFRVTAEMVARAVTPRTKLIILNSPSNPSGAVMSPEDQTEVVRFAAQRGIWVMSDECYVYLNYTDRQFSVGSLRDYRDRIVIAGSLSKTYAMTGWRIGYLGAPEPIAKAIDAIQSHSTSNPCSFAQKGGLAALKGDQQPVSDMRDEFDLRRQYMVQRLSAIDRLSVVKPQGAFYVLVNIAKLGLSSTNFADRLLSKHQVAVVPGIAFGNDNTIRLSYATSMDVIKKGLDRLEEFCRTL
jgi:aspartate aminotransferase